MPALLLYKESNGAVASETPIIRGQFMKTPDEAIQRLDSSIRKFRDEVDRASEEVQRALEKNSEQIASSPLIQEFFAKRGVSSLTELDEEGRVALVWYLAGRAPQN
jgi:hypothetical protein